MASRRGWWSSGVGVTTWLRIAAQSGAERWFGCLGLSLDSFFLLIVELGWADPMFGQQAIDLGFKSSSLSLERATPKVEHCQPRRFPEELQNFDCQFSKVEQRNCGKKSDQAQGSLCAASLRSLTIWKTNCGLHDQYKEGRSKRTPSAE